MMFDPSAPVSPSERLKQIPGFYLPTPLLSLPACADYLGVRDVLIKDETNRSLGSFKSLGGTYAALRALARHAAIEFQSLLAGEAGDLPELVCASDGNHGLAVAAAARYAGANARIFLHQGVDVARARRIENEGARIVWISGTYDDAVSAARAAAIGSETLLVADTSAAADDPIIADVMAGYGVLVKEVRSDIDRCGWRPPTHAFVQAGVGGLAAAVADGSSDWMGAPRAIVVVEPASAACVAPALKAGLPVRVKGTLETSAEMLSCGEASAPALEILLRNAADGIIVSEEELLGAPALLRSLGGPATTPSGAAGFAGALAAARDLRRTRVPIDADSTLLLLVTERLEETIHD